MSLHDTAARFVAQHGESMVLARTSEASTVTLKGKRIPGTTVEVGGSAVQQSFRVKVGVAELAASAWSVKEPKRGDTITVAGVPRAIEDARPLGDGGVTGLWELEVVG